MGAYKYYNPSTGKWEIIKSKSIVKPDGSLEYTPDDIKEIDDKIDILSGTSGTKEKANKEDLDAHKADYATPHKYEDEGQDPNWSGARYRLVMINGEPFMEVVEI